MATIDELVIKISADTKGAIENITKVEKNISLMEATVGKSAASIRSATTKMVKAFALVGAAATVLSAVTLKSAVSTFIDFEQAVTNAASVTGQSGAQYEATKANIEDLARTLGATTVFSASQAASAMYDLASAGYAVGEMATSDLEPILSLSAATQSDLTFATETVSSALGQFGLGIADSARVSDVMAKAIGNSKATLDKLSISLRTVGPIANAMGLSIEETTAMLGAMYNAGMKGEQAATGLKTAMAILAAPTATIASELERLGISIEDVDPATVKFTDILETLKNSGASTADIFKIFGREGAASISVLLENTSGIRDLESALYGAGGAAKDMADKQLATLGGALTLLKSAIEGVKITIGSLASDSVKSMAMSFRDALPAIETFITDGLKKIIQTVEDLTPTWNNLKSTFDSTAGIISDITDAFKDSEGGSIAFADAMNALTGALASVFAWIDRHPTITKLAVALGVAAVAFSAIVSVVTTVGAAISGILGVAASLELIFLTTTTTTAFLGGVITALGGPITLIIVAIALLAGAWATNMFGIRDITNRVFGTLRSMFIDLVNFIGPKLETLINFYVDVFNAMVPVLNAAGFELQTMAELHFNAISKAAKDAAVSVEESTTQMADAMTPGGETGLPTTTPEPTIAGTIAGSAGGTTSGIPEWAGKSDYIRERMTLTGTKTLDDLMGMSGISEMASGISSGMTEQATQATQLSISTILSQSLEVHKSSNAKLDMLNKLTEVSAKLDTLKIEVNNYITNVTKSSGGFGVKESLKGTQSGV